MGWSLLRSKTSATRSRRTRWVRVGLAWLGALALVGSWGVGVWIILQKAAAVAREEAILQRQGELNQAAQKVARLTETLRASYETAKRSWYPPDAPAVPLLEEVEGVAQSAGLAWKTRSAREVAQNEKLPAAIVLVAEFEGTKAALQNFLQAVRELSGRPHPLALTLEKGEGGRWQGTITLQIFRAPASPSDSRESHQRRDEPMGNPDEHP